VIVRKPVWSLQKAEPDDIKIQAEIAAIDQGILAKMGDRVSNEVNFQGFPEIPIDIFGQDEDEISPTDELQEPGASKPDVVSYTEDKQDESLAAVVDIPQAGEIETGTVTRQLQVA
jgi:hypothetical protein